MNIRNNGQNSKAEKIRNKDIIEEAHREIDDFRETKKTVTELLKYRQSMLDKKRPDAEMKASEAESKAINAINHLFDDEIKGKGE